jgi:hypothetical protein
MRMVHIFDTMIILYDLQFVQKTYLHDLNSGVQHPVARVFT